MKKAIFKSNFGLYPFDKKDRLIVFGVRNTKHALKLIEWAAKKKNWRVEHVRVVVKIVKPKD